MKKILIHICCGICSSHPIAQLKEEGFIVSGYFYNPNIYPLDEYHRRLAVTTKVGNILKYEFITGPYDNKNWLDKIQGLEGEPEGRARCEICFKMRLQATFEKAKEIGYDYFTSTLSISPHKDSQLIASIGRAISQKSFMEYDFKKQDGFKKTINFAKSHFLYRQNYCGCQFSQQA